MSGHVCKDGVVTTAGLQGSLQLVAETGWMSMPFAPEFGGQGLPAVVSMAVNEMWKGANMAFGLCPMLTGGAIEAIAHHASDELKQKYLPKMVEGTWNRHDEPDRAERRLRTLRPPSARRPRRSATLYLGDLRTKDLHHLGRTFPRRRHIHLVLARLPGCPAGLKGILAAPGAEVPGQ